MIEALQGLLWLIGMLVVFYLCFKLFFSLLWEWLSR